MEYLDGETLAARLSRGPLTLNTALTVAIHIAEALDEAHRAGIVHRDLKPGNVIVRPDGTAKVLDFGLARLARPGVELAGDATTRQTLTIPGTLMGTPHYMSPEQVRGETADATTDLWSLGVILYEALAGQRPFDGGSQAEILSSIIAREPSPLSSLNRDVPPEAAAAGGWPLEQGSPSASQQRRCRRAGTQAIGRERGGTTCTSSASKGCGCGRHGDPGFVRGRRLVGLWRVEAAMGALRGSTARANASRQGRLHRCVSCGARFGPIHSA